MIIILIIILIVYECIVNSDIKALFPLPLCKYNSNYRV